ncbi:ribonuclease H-like domain-containing protein [Tanacetum coccineum]
MITLNWVLDHLGSYEKPIDSETTLSSMLQYNSIVIVGSAAIVYMVPVSNRCPSYTFLKNLLATSSLKSTSFTGTLCLSTLLLLRPWLPLHRHGMSSVLLRGEVVVLNLHWASPRICKEHPSLYRDCSSNKVMPLQSTSLTLAYFASQALSFALSLRRQRRFRASTLSTASTLNAQRLCKCSGYSEVNCDYSAGVSTEDANKKFLRSLPSSWSQVSLVMRTKLGVDILSFDDLYNNLRVFEFDVKGSTGSSSSAQNIAFVSSESTSSTNDVSTAYGVSTSSGYNSQRKNSSSYTDELMYSFFANQSSGPQLDHEDLEQLDEFDLEEIDLKWQVAMISMRLKKFYKMTGTLLENADQKEIKEEPKALVTLDGEGVDWTSHAEDEQENFALMAYCNLGSDTESETTQTVSALKLPILKTGDYDLWSMRIEQYLTHTDYALWEVIMNGDAPANASTSTEGPISAKTAKQKLARNNELKAKSTLKQSRPGLEATKNQKCIKPSDAKHMLLRSLPSAWNNIALIMRNKADLDELSMDDLYNNLKVTNEAVNTAHEVSTARSHGQASSLTYADDVMFSFFVNQSNSSQLNNEDLEQIDTDDLEEMDLKWQVAMLTMRVNRFLKKTERNLNSNAKKTVGFDKTNVECYNCHVRGHFARECRAPRNYEKRNGDSPRRIVPVETPTNALVVQDGIGGYDWSFQAEEGITNFCSNGLDTSQGSSSSSSSDSKVHTYSKDCLKSYETLQKQYDQQRVALNKSNLEIIGYQMGLESLESRIVVHEKNELEEALKEKDDLKLKLEKFEESSKNLTILINSQISAKDKAGLGYDSQMNESEVFPLLTLGTTCPQELTYPLLDYIDSIYKTNVSETISSVPRIKSTASKSSKDSLEQPKDVRHNDPIIEDWDTDSDNDSVFRPKPDQTKPKFTKINFVKSEENVKSVYKENTHWQEEYPRKSQSPRDNIRNWNGMMTQKLGNAVATKSGLVPLNAAKQSSPRAAISISIARHVNTATLKPKVNAASPTKYSYFKAHSPLRRPFNQKSAAKTNNFNKKVYTAKVNNVTTTGPEVVVSTAEGKRENVVKSSACWIWRPT